MVRDNEKLRFMNCSFSLEQNEVMENMFSLGHTRAII